MLKRLCLYLIAVFFLAGCGGTVTSSSVSQLAEIDSVAVVSLSVNNYCNFGNPGMIQNDLITNNMPQVLERTEDLLSNRFSVRKAASFVDDPAYRNLTIGSVKSGLLAPVINGFELPSFSEDRRQVLRGELAKDKALKLCTHLKVDAVILIYSEWTAATGRMVPTTRALTKNCVAMYNKDGSKLFYDRKDIQGDRVIGGAFAGLYINEGTIEQWVNAYERGIRSAILSHF